MPVYVGTRYILLNPAPVAVEEDAAATGTIFAQDDFTGAGGTNLTAHTPDVGGSWIKHAASTGDAIISNANRARHASVNNIFPYYYNNGTPGSADYDVQTVVFVKSLETFAFAGVLGRWDTAATTGYRFTYNSSSGAWFLYVDNAGTPTQLGTASQTLTDETGYTIRLQMRSDRIKCFVDGTEIISVTDSTVSAAGKAGIYLGQGTGNDLGRLHIDDFIARDV